jgi:hypothetical protein
MYSFNNDLVNKINNLKSYQKDTIDKIENKRKTLKNRNFNE